jgi:hypothetical protein
MQLCVKSQFLTWYRVSFLSSPLPSLRLKRRAATTYFRATVLGRSVIHSRGRPHPHPTATSPAYPNSSLAAVEPMPTMALVALASSPLPSRFAGMDCRHLPTEEPARPSIVATRHASERASVAVGQSCVASHTCRTTAATPA